MPYSWRERPTAKSQMSIISWTSPRPSCAIFPTSSVTSAPRASFSRRSSSPSSRTSSPRRGAGTSRHASNAAAARAIAASVDAASSRATRPISFPVIGVRMTRSPSVTRDASTPRRASSSPADGCTVVVAIAVDSRRRPEAAGGRHPVRRWRAPAPTCPSRRIARSTARRRARPPPGRARDRRSARAAPRPA